MTALSVLGVVLAIGTSHNWAALLGGHVTMVIWSTQIAITNLVIAALPFDRWFPAKALAVALASVFLLPFMAIADHERRWWLMGQPDVAGYVAQATASRCTMVGSERKWRMRGHFAYGVEATLRCAGENRTRACNWSFWYDKTNQQWKATLPLSLTCVPGES